MNEMIIVIFSVIAIIIFITILFIIIFKRKTKEITGGTRAKRKDKMKITNATYNNNIITVFSTNKSDNIFDVETYHLVNKDYYFVKSGLYSGKKTKRDIKNKELSEKIFTDILKQEETSHKDTLKKITDINSIYKADLHDNNRLTHILCIRKEYLAKINNLLKFTENDTQNDTENKDDPRNRSVIIIDMILGMLTSLEEFLHIVNYITLYSLSPEKRIINISDSIFVQNRSCGLTMVNIKETSLWDHLHTIISDNEFCGGLLKDFSVNNVSEIISKINNNQLYFIKEYFKKYLYEFIEIKVFDNNKALKETIVGDLKSDNLLNEITKEIYKQEIVKKKNKFIRSINKTVISKSQMSRYNLFLWEKLLIDIGKPVDYDRQNIKVSFVRNRHSVTLENYKLQLLIPNISEQDVDKKNLRAYPYSETLYLSPPTDYAKITLIEDFTNETNNYTLDKLINNTNTS